MDSPVNKGSLRKFIEMPIRWLSYLSMFETPIFKHVFSCFSVKIDIFCIFDQFCIFKLNYPLKDISAHLFEHNNYLILQYLVFKIDKNL